MSQIAEWAEAGRKTQNAAPRRDAAENEIKPWVEQANKWYGGLLVILRKECTPQAVAVAQDLSRQTSVSYGAIDQAERFRTHITA